MKGTIFALLGGIFITLQGVANTRISQNIGTWQAATITQMTGFIVALILVALFRDKSWQQFKRVKPMYLTGGAFAAVVIFSNVTAMNQIGVTISIATVLIAQLGVTFLTDSYGWFGVLKQEMKLPQFVGIGLMISGVIILSL